MSTTPTPEQLQAAEQQLTQLKREIAANPDPAAHTARNEPLIDASLTVTHNREATTWTEDDKVVEEYEPSWISAHFEKSKRKLHQLQRRVKGMTLRDGMIFTAQGIPQEKNDRY